MGGVDEASDVVSDDVGEEDAAGECEEACEFCGVHDWGDGGFDAEFAVADDAFEGGGVVAEDFEFEEEAVDLGFGERVGAFEFDWVLSGEDEEGIGEVVAGAEDGDAAFLHGFEEGALGFGAGAVDFVGEDEVGEDGAWLEDEGAAFGGFAEDWVAGDVAGEEVWGELDAAGGEAEGFGEAFDEFGLPRPGRPSRRRWPRARRPVRVREISSSLPKRTDSRVRRSRASGSAAAATSASLA
jgi:hypothetical protein